MTQNTRLKLGKLWKEQIEAGIPRKDGITIDHPYIKEYEESIKENSKPTKKVK